MLIIFFGLIYSFFLVNHEGISIESRCQDGKAEYQIWHVDVGGKVQKLNLKGHGKEYYKKPVLIPKKYL